MLGLPESVLVFGALAITVGILLLALAELLPRETRAVTRTFWCPFRRMEVTVEFREDAFGHGRYLDVTSCTAFRPESAIQCGKLCRFLGNFPSRPSVSISRA